MVQYNHHSPFHTHNSIGLRMGFQLVASVGLFCADRYGWHRGTHMGRT